MSTAGQIVNDALIEIGALGIGQTASADDAAFCLRKLNQIIERLSNQRLAFPVLQEFSVTLTGAASYTIGPGGSPVTLRPLTVRRATAIDANGLEYDVRVLNQGQWDSIAQKDVTGGPPDAVWYQASVTNGVINVYPKSTGYTLKLDAQGLLAGVYALATSLTFPEGYESALMLTLADDIGSAFGKPTSADIRRRAAAAVALIKRTNYEPILSDSPMFGGQDSYIERGY